MTVLIPNTAKRDKYTWVPVLHNIHGLRGMQTEGKQQSEGKGTSLGNVLIVVFSV